jgi:hypothetical protein
MNLIQQQPALTVLARLIEVRQTKSPCVADSSIPLSIRLPMLSI